MLMQKVMAMAMQLQRLMIFISLSGHVSLPVATERNLFLETGSYMYIG